MRGGAVRATGRFAITASMVGVAGCALLAVAGSADAASISAPSLVTRPARVTITAHTDAVQGARLIFNGKVVTSAGAVQLGSTLSYTFETARLRNGAYPVELQQELGVLPWRTAASTAIRLRVPPAVPTDVDARLVSVTAVRVTWARGAEPDLTSYDVLTTAGADVRGLRVSHVCEVAACASTVALSGQARQSEGFRVVAHRSDGSGGTLASVASPIAYVNVRGSVGTRAAAGHQSDGRAGSYGAGSGSDGRYLPLQALPGGSALVLPTVGPGYKTVLPAQSERVAGTRTAGGGGTAAWYVMLAVGLVVLLAAGHLITWKRRKPAHAGPQGPDLLGAGGHRRSTARRPHRWHTGLHRPSAAPTPAGIAVTRVPNLAQLEIVRSLRKIRRTARKLARDSRVESP